MNLIHLDKIKSLENTPKKINIFSEKEIKMIKELYYILPESTFNNKQNVRKKAWLQNFNKELDEIYFSRLKEVLGDCKMDSLKSDREKIIMDFSMKVFHLSQCMWIQDLMKEQ